MATVTAYADISSHNGTPDLRAYWNAGHRTLCLKATEGTGYAWSAMQQLARAWHAFGPDARCIYYHWLYGTFTGRAQFDWFWAHVSPVFRAGDLLMTDFEDVDASRWTSDATHLQVVKEFNALGDRQAPVLDYAPNWYLANMPLCIAYFKTRPWWVASDYSHSPPLNPNGFRLAAHQTTDRATVAGFAGPVDYNRWYSDPAGDDHVATTLTDADTKAVAEAVFDKLFRTDGVFPGPAPVNPANPTLTLYSIINLTLNYSKQARDAAVAAQAGIAALAKAEQARDAAATAALTALRAAVAKLPTAPGGTGPVDLTALAQAAHDGAAAGAATLDGVAVATQVVAALGERLRVGQP